MNLARGWKLVALAAIGAAVSACGSPSDQESVDSNGPSSDNPASSDSPTSSNGGGLHLHGKKNGLGPASSDGNGTGGDGSDGGAGGSDTGSGDSGASTGDSDASTNGGGGGDAGSASDAGSGSDTDAGGGSEADAGGGSDTDGGSGSASDGGSQPPDTGAPMLNLSSISCTDNGTVDVHFVLLFAGSATPGDLSGTYNGGSFGPSAPERNTGNVWHYDVFLPAGDIDITSAEVTALGQTIELHNPDAYTDTYSCGAPPPACSVQVSAQDEICLDKPLGSETAECSYFGLSLIAKDIPTTASNTFSSTENALLAIVKTGTGDCGPGMAAYRTYTDVTVGEVLSAPGGQDISHVTYCKCPDSL